MRPQPIDYEKHCEQQDQHRPDVDLLHHFTVLPALSRDPLAFAAQKEKADAGSSPA
jgi:hypothetical protein